MSLVGAQGVDPRGYFETFRRELKEQFGRRVTVLWECSGSIACTTGRIIEVGQDFVEIFGLVPTFIDAASQFFPGCEDLQAVELETVIRLEAICAVVQDVPSGRKAGLPYCCAALDPPAAAAKS